MSKASLVFAFGLLGSLAMHAQVLAQTADPDVWSNVPQASDDRFTNPKSKLYAGPNGWYNSGQVRAGLEKATTAAEVFKGGLNHMSTPEAFVLVDEKKQTRVLTMGFGTNQPAPGDYQVAAKADPAQKKVAVNLAEVSDGKVLEWAGSAPGSSGVVTVSLVHGYRYFKARGLRLGPTGPSNSGALKQPMILGVEGAVAPD